MSEKISAFPHPVPVGAWGDPSCGMSLRDYFAAKVMQSIMSQPDMSGPPYNVDAKHAYAAADAMLAAREAKS